MISKGPANYLIPTWKTVDGTLPKDYEFYCNYYIENGMLWHTVSGGAKGGSDFGNWLNIQVQDNNKIFGPPEAQKSWSLEKLHDLKAVGCYRHKEK